MTTGDTMSTTTVAAWDVLADALRQRHPLEVRYHGRSRLLCPHALGWNNGRALLLAYQTGGQTSTGTLDPNPRKRWRCLLIDDIDQLNPAEPTATCGTADNYDASHPFPANTTHCLAITNDPNTAG